MQESHEACDLTITFLQTCMFDMKGEPGSHNCGCKQAAVDSCRFCRTYVETLGLVDRAQSTTKPNKDEHRSATVAHKWCS